MSGWMGWDGMDPSQTTTTTRAPLAVLIIEMYLLTDKYFYIQSMGRVVNFFTLLPLYDCAQLYTALELRPEEFVLLSTESFLLGFSPSPGLPLLRNLTDFFHRPNLRV